MFTLEPGIRVWTSQNGNAWVLRNTLVLPQLQSEDGKFNIEIPEQKFDEFNNVGNVKVLLSVIVLSLKLNASLIHYSPLAYPIRYNGNFACKIKNFLAPYSEDVVNVGFNGLKEYDSANTNWTSSNPVSNESSVVETRGYCQLFISGLVEFEFQAPICQNIPDGQAAITLIYEELGTGQKSAIQRSFDFRDSMVYVNFFNYWNNFPGDSSDFVIIGYRVKASKGFTHGTVRLLEGWSKSPSGSLLEKVKDRGTIQLTSGETDGFLAVQDYSRSSVLEGIPEYLTGHVTLECNFAVPECVDETYQGLPDDDYTYIQTTVFNTVDESIEIHIIDGEGLTEELTKIDEPIPPEEPESGCDCEKYQAKLIYEGLKYIQKTLDVRLSQFLIAQNEANKQLVTALVSGLKPLVTNEEEPRGIADVLNEKEFDPFIMVDTNEAFYKKLMPPEGNAWIGDMP